MESTLYYCKFHENLHFGLKVWVKTFSIYSGLHCKPEAIIYVPICCKKECIGRSYISSIKLEMVEGSFQFRYMIIFSNLSEVCFMSQGMELLSATYYWAWIWKLASLDIGGKCIKPLKIEKGRLYQMNAILVIFWVILQGSWYIYFNSY